MWFGLGLMLLLNLGVRFRISMVLESVYVRVMISVMVIYTVVPSYNATSSAGLKLAFAEGVLLFQAPH